MVDYFQSIDWLALGQKLIVLNRYREYVKSKGLTVTADMRALYDALNKNKQLDPCPQYAGGDSVKKRFGDRIPPEKEIEKGCFLVYPDQQ